jgi:hypothetical protein
MTMLRLTGSLEKAVEGVAQYGVFSSCELIEGAAYCLLTMGNPQGVVPTTLGVCAPASIPPAQLLALVTEASLVRETRAHAMHLQCHAELLGSFLWMLDRS